MNFYNQSKQEYLFRAGLRINNSLGDETVKNAVAAFGYTEEKLNQGAALLSEAETLFEKQQKEYGDVDAAYDTLNKSREAAHGQYMIAVRIARIAFKDDVQATATLELNRRRATTLSGWLKQALNFYHSLLDNENWINAMAQYGFTSEKLAAGLQLVEDVNVNAELVNKEKGDAQNATQVRDMKFEELHEWLSDYEEIARIALAANPQLLEKLGIVVKS